MGTGSTNLPFVNEPLVRRELQNSAKGREILWGFDRQMKPLPFDELTDITQNDCLDYAEQILILHGTEDEMVALSISLPIIT